MADDSAGNFGGGTSVLGTVKPDLADKYLYFYKLDTWDKTEVAHVLGLQGATSGTNTKTVTTTQTKQSPIKTVGSPTQQRTVLSYFQTEDGILADMKKAWQFNITVHLYRLNLNQVSGTAPARTAPCEYSQCVLGAVPQTENLGGIMQASLVFEVQGYAQEGNITEDNFETAAFDTGLNLYNFLAPLKVGGSTDASYTNANASKPTADEGDDKFMHTQSGDDNTSFGTGGSTTSSSSTAGTTGSGSTTG